MSFLTPKQIVFILAAPVALISYTVDKKIFLKRRQKMAGFEVRDGSPLHIAIIIAGSLLVAGLVYFGLVTG